MPKIQLTAPVDTLTEEGRATIQATLVRTLMKWEGPDEVGRRTGQLLPGPVVGC
ncbi:MAG: hypothetical protein ACRDQ1_05705 [Sciscionella sp.]